jgi:putative Mn2+ efflux pump MntP
MIAETFTFYALIVILLGFFAEFSKKPVFGLFGSILLILLGIYVITDGLQLKTGETNAITQLREGTDLTDGTTDNSTYSETTTLNETITETSTTTYEYTSPTLPGFPINSLGLILVLLGLYSVYAYVLEINE